jgi:hypothetical protein
MSLVDSSADSSCTSRLTATRAPIATIQIPQQPHPLRRQHLFRRSLAQHPARVQHHHLFASIACKDFAVTSCVARANKTPSYSSEEMSVL